MASKKEVRAFLNAISIKMYGKRYQSLSSRKSSLVRKKAVRIAFRKKTR